MTIQEYARAVAEAVLDECYDEWGLEGGRRKQVDLDAIIASVPPPTAQHHAAPTCDGWWWARYHGWHPDPVRGTWVAVKVTNLNSPGWRTRYDRYVGPLLPPDTTEPAPVATPTPDIDPEEVGRALDVLVSGGETNFTALIAAAREYLRLREQPAPDVQAHCVGCGHAAHALECSEQGCLCPHSTDVQAYKEMYECGYEAGRDEVQAQAEWCARLPDGSGAAVVSFPLPDNHWLTAEHENVPPMPFRMGTDDPRRTEWKNAIRDAGKYAVRCATMNGADNDFDPDALVQNLVVGMIGYFTPDGFSSDAWANPEQPTPAILTDTDAAVAREREIWVEAMNRMVPISGVREVLFRGVDRARSAKGV